MLIVDSLDVSYGKKRVLRDVSFGVAEGSVTAVLGVNGAGKTTLLRAISGIVPADGGVVLDGSSVGHLRPWDRVRAGIAHVPEGRQVFPEMTIEDHLEIAHEHAGLDRGFTKDRVFGLFPKLGERRRQAGGSLSGGEQQMLAVGRALMSQPVLLMLDEPSHGLAPMLVDGLTDMIKEVSKSVTVLLVEQNLSVPTRIATDVVLLENGAVTHAGAASEVLAGDYVQRVYLGSSMERDPAASNEDRPA